MHTTKVLHKLLSNALPSIHSVRLDTLMAAVNSLVCGAKASVTSLGRGLAGNAYGKHKINAWIAFCQTRASTRNAFRFIRPSRKLLSPTCQNLLSRLTGLPLCADQSFQLLRAAIPVGGRSLTLYEEIHPRSKLGN